MAGIFKAYDVRGVYGDDLNEKEAYLIAYSLVKFKNLKEFKVAHDLRLSHEPLTKFFIKGLIDAGCKPIYLGKSSTPNFYFSLFEGVNSGVQITASHNSKEYNGLKLMIELESFDTRNGLKDLGKLVEEDKDNIRSLFEKIENEIKEISLKELLFINDIKEESTLAKYTKFLNDYYEEKLTTQEKNAINNLKFIVDYSSGVSSLAVEPFLKSKGLNYFPVNEIPNGNFPSHEPDPSKAKDYIKTLDIENIEFAVAFDGDGDRLCFYDENKEFVLPDYPMALYIEEFLKEGNHFVVDLRASRILKDICKKNNAHLELIRVGRSFYQDYMKENDCVFGGELSGHLFFKDFRYLDNADIALINILKIIAQHIITSKKEFTFSDMINHYKVYHKIKETNLRVSDADLVFDKLEEQYKEHLKFKIDGLSFDEGDFWFNVRKSNTEPIIRINFEGKEKQKTEKEFEKLVNFIKLV